MSNSDPKTAIEGELLGAVDMQLQLAKLERELMHLEAFQNFIQLTKAVNDKMADVRKNIEAVMVPAYVAGEIDKSVKGEWGSVTVTESDVFDVDQSILQPKFFKKVVDTTKIRDTYHLEGKPPKGTTPSKKYGIMIKFK